MAEIPWLQTLDRIKVTQQEILDAKELKKKMKKLNNYRFKTKKPPKSEEELEFEGRQNRLLENALKKFEQRVKERRIFLDTLYIPYDRRMLGLVNEEVFLRVLRETSLYELLTEEEEEAILRKYRTRLMVEAISSTMTMARGGISYKRFCADLLPLELRTLRDEWKFPEPSTISDCGKDLDRYVKTVKRNRALEEETLKRTALLQSSSSAPEIESFKTVQRKSKLESHGLDPWAGSELLKFVKRLRPQDGSFKKEDVLMIFQKMIDVGKVPILGAGPAAEVLLTNNLGELVESIAENVFRHCIGLESQPGITYNFMVLSIRNHHILLLMHY